MKAKNFKVTMKDIKNMQRATHLLDIYARDREDYSKSEYKEAKRVANTLEKFYVKLYNNITKGL